MSVSINSVDGVLVSKEDNISRRGLLTIAVILIITVCLGVAFAAYIVGYNCAMPNSPAMCVWFIHKIIVSSVAWVLVSVMVGIVLLTM